MFHKNTYHASKKIKKKHAHTAVWNGYSQFKQPNVACTYITVIFHMNSDGDRFYIKIVDLDDIYDFVVQTSMTIKICTFLLGHVFFLQKH
jgi:hypothetical protein